MKDIDILIIGAGIDGVKAAETVVDMGLRVAIAERRTYPGAEITASHHAWIRNGKTNFEIPMPVGATKKYLTRKLLDLNVPLLLMSPTVGLSVKDDLVTGVVLGNKFGIQFLGAKMIIDTTQNRIALRHLGKMKHYTGNAIVSYTFDMEGIETIEESEMISSSELELTDNKIYFHQLSRNKTVSVEMRFFAEIKETIYNRTQIERLARKKAVETAFYLKSNHEAFKNAEICSLGSETVIKHEDLSDVKECELPKNLLSFFNSLPFDFSTNDISILEEDVEKQVKSFITKQMKTPLPECSDIYSFGNKINNYKISDFEDRNLKVNLKSVELTDLSNIPSVTTDVIVAGAGTSGAMSALALCHNKTNTVVVEQLFDLGGTSTVGLVTGLWHGYRGGMFEKVKEEIKNCKESEISTHISKMLFYQHRLESENMHVLGGTTICGASLDKNRVNGVLTLSDDGLCYVKSKVVIDTTADADVCAFAGAEFEVGDPRDGYVQNYSQWGIEQWKNEDFKQNRFLHDLDVIKPNIYSELLRGLYLSYTINSDYQISDLLTMRESRRVVGEYSLNFKDILNDKIFEDVISVSMCAMDSHSRITSPLFTLGLIGEKFFANDQNDLYVRMPYRCFIPKEINGLLVAAKAVSGKRDATCLCRMNSDISNAGYAIGLAASLAVNVDNVRNIDIKSLQTTLSELEILPKWAFEGREYMSFEERTELLKTDEIQDILPLLILDKQDAVSIVENFKSTTLCEKIKASAVLSYFGKGDAQPLIDKLREEEELDIKREEQIVLDRGIVKLILPAGERVMRHYGGALSIPDDDKECSYTRVNRLISLIGYTGDKNGLKSVLKVADRAFSGGRHVTGRLPYPRSHRTKHRVPMHARLFCLARAIECLADSSAIPVLERLLNDENVCGYVTKVEFNEVSSYQSCDIEIALSVALARCGGKKGFEILIEYLSDVRYVLSQRAHSELCEISGEDFGFCEERWFEWLAKEDEFAIKPYTIPPYILDI